MKNKSYNNFFMNFASPSKFRIIMALKKKPLSVTDIVEHVGEEQSAVSHNLRRLVQCHILDVRKQGKKRIYSINKETVIPMLRVVEEHVKRCCLGRCGK